MHLTLIRSLLLLNMLVSGTHISQTKCSEYRKMFPTQYHEGEDAVPKEFPFMAKIGNITQYLNGILISEDFVLSVAFINFSDAVVVLGDLELWTNTDDAQPKTYKVIDTFTHPDFNEYYAFADIKLYQLNESIQFNEYVRPACLSLNNLSASEGLTQIGWGSTNIRNNNILHKINLNYISNKRCEDVFKIAGRPKVVKHLDKKEMFCAESRKGSRRMVLGIGSALIDDDPDALDEVIGFLDYSLTSGEANVNVFVRVASYIDWIESIAWPNHTTLAATQSTNEIETETVPSTSTVTQSSNESVVKTFPMKFFYSIIATIFLILTLCVLIVCTFCCLVRKARLNNMPIDVDN